MASAIASRSCPQSFASTLIASAPLAFIAKGYMAKPCFEYIAVSPEDKKHFAINSIISFDPFPTVTIVGNTSNEEATFSLNADAFPSGYLFKSVKAEITS